MGGVCAEETADFAKFGMTILEAMEDDECWTISLK